MTTFRCKHICKPLQARPQTKVCKRACFAHPKKQEISHLKNKTLLIHNPIDKNELIEIVDKQKGMSLEKKEGLLVTKCSSNKGFSGNSSILPRSNFRLFRQESSPKSLTAATLNR